MTLFPFLIGFYIILGVFFIFNIFIIKYIYRFKYLGPKAIRYVLIFYSLTVLIILIITHIFIFEVDWNEELISIY